MYLNSKRKNLNGRIQSTTLFATSCQEMLVAAKQETLAPFLCSLPVQNQFDKTKKCIWNQKTVFLISPQQSLVSIFLTFYRNFLSNTDVMDCSPDDPCYLNNHAETIGTPFPLQPAEHLAVLVKPQRILFYSSVFLLWFLI